MRSSKEQSLRATNSICWPLHKKKNHYRTKNATRRKKVKFQTILNPIQSNANIEFIPPEKEGNKPIIIKRRGSSNKQDRQKEGRKKKKKSICTRWAENEEMEKRSRFRSAPSPPRTTEIPADCTWPWPTLLSGTGTRTRSLVRLVLPYPIKNKYK